MGENIKEVKSPSPNKKVVASKMRTVPSTGTRSSKLASDESAKKTPSKDPEPNKSNKSSNYKPSKPLNPIELIDELQGIEDFLRESTNESKSPEEKVSPKKYASNSECKATTIPKSPTHTPGPKIIEISSEDKSAL